MFCEPKKASLKIVIRLELDLILKLFYPVSCRSSSRLGSRDGEKSPKMSHIVWKRPKVSYTPNICRVQMSMLFMFSDDYEALGSSISNITISITISKTLSV